VARPHREGVVIVLPFSKSPSEAALTVSVTQIAKLDNGENGSNHNRYRN
jgi:hypothetical protein